MKKYLSLAVVLGAIAFLSVSYLAQAQAPAAPSAPEATAGTPVAPAVVYAKDRSECDALASAPTTEGVAPSDADKAVALKKCLVGKGHTDDEISKEEAQHAAPAAIAPPAAAPAAPATH